MPIFLDWHGSPEQAMCKRASDNAVHTRPLPMRCTSRRQGPWPAWLWSWDGTSALVSSVTQVLGKSSASRWGGSMCQAPFGAQRRKTRPTMPDGSKHYSGEPECLTLALGERVASLDCPPPALGACAPPLTQHPGCVLTSPDVLGGVERRTPLNALIISYRP